MTTDPIGQARERIRYAHERVEFAILAGSQDGWTDARRDEHRAALANVEQAILRYHPDVVRLVLAARRAMLNLPHLGTCMARLGRPCDCTKGTVAAALVPFTTEEESE